uniref:protein-histidine N-methyltransferase n=1 Tax=Rodentolepis nana TaxID=102285 RepID=A0A0R3TQX9_RODNA
LSRSNINMISFKFNFFDKSEENQENAIKIHQMDSNSTRPVPLQLSLGDGWERSAILPKRNFTYGDDKVICILREDQVEECVKNFAPEIAENMEVIKALSSNIDVISGVVEGGFTVWDGTRHLLNYLVKENMNFKDKRILDLGCGAGLMGIHALINGAKFVLFQEFNQCVVKAWTINNVKIQSSIQHNQMDFWSGDWEDLANIWSSQERQFDIILTAETIYRPELYPKLLKVFESVSAPDCQIYVAGKLTYCGNGGTFEGFSEFVNNEGGFSCKKVQIESGNTCYGCLMMTRTREK